MKPVSPVFPGTNFEEIKVAEHQPEYQTLPVVSTGGDYIVSRWKLDEIERKQVEATGEFYICLVTFGGNPPDTRFQVDDPIAPKSERAKFLQPHTVYPGLALPVIAEDDQCIWMLLKLTGEDRKTVARDGNFYFFMRTDGKPVTPSLVQVENPLVGYNGEITEKKQ